MELNTRVSPFTQTFLKQYCDRKAWKLPGGQGRLDRAQCLPQRGRRSARGGLLLSEWKDPLQRGTWGDEFLKQGLILIGTTPGAPSVGHMDFPLTEFSFFGQNYHQGNICFLTYLCGTALQLFGLQIIIYLDSKTGMMLLWTCLQNG